MLNSRNVFLDNPPPFIVTLHWLLAGYANPNRFQRIDLPKASRTDTLFFLFPFPDGAAHEPLSSF
jgi:hypothetical protein